MTTEHNRYLRNEQPYSIIIIDVDCFKAYNDSLGHQKGDDCLQRIAQAIDATCRRIDFCGRYGGEEFIVLAPETDGDAGLRLAERIRKAVWSLAIPHPCSTAATRITASLGIATSGPDDWEQVLKNADDALYVAKRAGRNMVFVNRGTPNEAATIGALSTNAEAAGESASADRPITVLVVDDDPTIRAICRASLRKVGYEVHEAADGREALKRVTEVHPDVIVMDVMMPKLDGLECTRQLRANPDTQDIPIILVSALGENSEVLAGLEAGADEYVTKPLRTTELQMRVRSMARLRREQSDLLRSYEYRGDHMRILTRLVEYCREVGVSRRTDEVLEHTVTAVADVAASRRIAIMLPDEERRLLTVAHSIGIDEELACTVRVPVGEPIAGQVFAAEHAFVVNDPSDRLGERRAYDGQFFTKAPLISTPMSGFGRVVGVLNVTDRVNGRSFEPHELEYVELISKIAGTAIYDINLRVARDQASDSIMVALAKLAEHRDNDTGMHLDRVTLYCMRLAEALRDTPRFAGAIDDAFLYNLKRAVPLHDIGKVAIPDQILLHPGKLTDEQMEVMRTHTTTGANTIQSLIENAPGVGFLDMAAEIARYHHERWDGRGYPAGLRTEQIPLAARITAVADVYDALTTERVYKKAFSHDRAVAIIVDGSGTQFDPDIVEAFIQLEREFAALARKMSDESNKAKEIDAPVTAVASVGNLNGK